VFGWLQADTVAAVWIAAAAIHREKNTGEAAAAAGLQPQQAAANKPCVNQWPAADLLCTAEYFAMENVPPKRNLIGSRMKTGRIPKAGIGYGY
jgi:hypothetical protein